MQKKTQDKIFAKKIKVEDFKFDKKITDAFDEMLHRSVPFYNEMQRMVKELVGNFAQRRTNIYDLGCSTGTTMANLIDIAKSKSIKIIGVDSSAHMLERTKERLKQKGLWRWCELKCADLNQPFTLHKPSVVILVLTLQFVRPMQREHLIKNIYDSLAKNGCLIVIEKILANDSTPNRLFIKLYQDYKKRMGYSELEISQKREALENVLIPYRVEENVMLLRRNGFPIVEIFFKWYNFAGFLAIKQ